MQNEEQFEVRHRRTGICLRGFLLSREHLKNCGLFSLASVPVMSSGLILVTESRLQKMFLADLYTKYLSTSWIRRRYFFSLGF